IRTVASGDSLLSPEVTRAVIERAVAGSGAAPDAARPAPTASVSAAASSLTERELEVLRLLAQGLSNEEIAEALFVGRATIKTHVSNVLLKLGLRDRVQAVAFAYQHGLAS